VPAYRYQCVHCQVQEIRIGGVDDHCALCVDCGHLMLRLDLDFFGPYFAAQPSERGSMLDQTGENV
jgi:hypothetical protein